MCKHGGMQTWGENYWKTYTPVVRLLSVRKILIVSKFHNLETRSIDFVLVSPQVDLMEDIYTKHSME